MNRRDIHFEDLTRSSVSARCIGGGGVMSTGRSILDLYEDLSVANIELSNVDGGWIHFSRRKNDWWIKRKEVPREYINFFYKGKQLNYYVAKVR